MRYGQDTVRAVLLGIQEGLSVHEVCRQHAVSPATVHRWRARHRLASPDPRRPYGEIAEENRRLKQLVGELTLENRELRAAVRRPGSAAR